MGCQHVLSQRSVVVTELARNAHTDLAGTSHSAPLARLFVREHLREHVDDDTLATVELLATELVTNVILHACTSIHLGITWDDRNILVTVQDTNTDPPTTRHQHLADDELTESGRGMMLIESLADDFGFSRLPDGSGKVMWFALARPISIPSQADPPA
jgi:anti-sigma regulatory factor (Ser/Thr protein kinase)